MGEEGNKDEGTAPTEPIEPTVHSQSALCSRVKVTEWRRKLDVAKNEHGGAEAQVFADADGQEYLVKAANNPQGGKVVVNDLVGGLALAWLGVLHPPTVIIDVPQELIASSPSAKFSNGVPFGAGESFGSHYWPSEPDSVVRASPIVNLTDVAGTMALDTWLANGDSRQFRGRLSDPKHRKFEFFPVDQGHCISHLWDASLAAGSPDAKDPPLAIDANSGTNLATHIHSFADRLDKFTQSDAEQIVSQVPTSWLKDDERAALASYLTLRAPAAANALRAKYPLKVVP
jgi:hypothetical protein